jgi:hypothetical protein
MTSKIAAGNPRIGRLALGLLAFALLAIALATIAAAKPWLKPTIGDTMFDLLLLAVGMVVMGYASSLASRIHRGMDEVHQASAGFAARWSIPAGQAAFVLLMFLTPVKDFMLSLVLEFGGPGPGMTVDRSVVKFAMMLGFMGVVGLQAIATVVLNVIWWKSKQ